MSAEDRRKWDARYRQGAYRTRRRPAAFLSAWADELPRRGWALDLACGIGRNARFLALRGLAVDAVDISPVALAAAKQQAGGLDIRWIEADLEAGFTPMRDYDVIVNIRYVQLDLVAALLPFLRPDGVLVVEQHLRQAPRAGQAAAVVGPSNPAFRVAPGALARLAGGLDIAHLEEGCFTDPDGGVAALARLIARRPRQGRPG